MPLACCSDSSSSEDEDDEEGADFNEDDEANRNAEDDEGNCNADEDGANHSQSCGCSAHEDADAGASFDGGCEQSGGSTDGMAADAQSSASRQAAIWRRLKRKHPGSLWAPATQRAS